MKDSAKLLGFDTNRDLVFDSDRRLSFDLNRRLLFNLNRNLNFDLDRDLEIRNRGVVFRGYVCPICGALVAKDANRCDECGVKFQQDKRSKKKDKKKRQSWDKKHDDGEHAVHGTRGGSKGIGQTTVEVIDEPPEQSAEQKFRTQFEQSSPAPPKASPPPPPPPRAAQPPPPPRTQSPPPPPPRAAPPPPPKRRDVFQCSSCGKVLYVGTKQCTNCGAVYGRPAANTRDTQQRARESKPQQSSNKSTSKNTTVSWNEYQKRDRKEGIVSWEDYIKSKSS